MFSSKLITYKHFNERDVETPALMHVLNQTQGVNSLLDVGAHYSWYSYAPAVREWMGHRRYDGIDVIKCAGTASIVDTFHVGSVMEVDLPPYDFVTCISSIEHSGITTYKVGDWRLERHAVWERLCTIAQQGIFITFPFGQEGLHEGQYANVTPGDLRSFQEVATRYRFITQHVQFFHTEFAQGQKPWEEIDYDHAAVVPMDRALGTQCVCIMTVQK